MGETPLGRYDYPDPDEENWNSEAAGGSPGPEDIWAQQEIEIQGSVATFGDLPTADGTETDDGQRRRYFVREDDIIVRDTGTGWAIIAGLGSEARPLPPSHHEAITTGLLGNNNGQFFFAGNQDGADADARLDAALSAAGNSDPILLEAATYTDDRTGSNAIDHPSIIRGMDQQFEGRTVIDADWELDSVAVLSHVRIDGDDTVTIGQADTSVSHVNCNGTLSLNAERITVSHIASGGTVQFESGTSNGEAGVLAGSLTTTDNGSNNFLT